MSNKVRNIRRRIIYISVFIFIVIIVIASTFIYTQEVVEKKAYLNMEEHTVNTHQLNIKTSLEDIITDLIILSRNNELESLLDTPTDKEIIKNLSENFQDISKYSRVYDQIRLLDTSGNEVIRVNFNLGTPIVVPSEQLQNKKDRYYFAEAIVLNKNEFYISPLDLNVENGAIESPLKPMIRIATPVFDSKENKRGVLLFNYFAQNTIDLVTKHNNALFDGNIMLLNSDGYFLKGISYQNEWGFMYKDKKNKTFRNRFGDIWLEIKNNKYGQAENTNGIFTFKTIYPLPDKSNHPNNGTYISPLSDITFVPKNYYWKLVSFVPYDSFYSKQNTRRNYGLLIVSALTISLILISRRLYKNQYANIKAQQELDAINERFQTTMNSIDAIVYVSDMQTYELLFANKAFVDSFGEYKGNKCYKTIHKGQNKKCDFCTNNLLIDENGKAKDAHVWEFQDTFSKKWYLCRDQAIRWSDGKLVRLEVAIDITEQKKVELALKKSEHQLKQAQETAHIGHWELNHKTNELYWSDEIYRIFNLKPQSQTPSFSLLLRLTHPNDRECVSETYNNSLKNRKKYAIIHRILTNNGTIKYVDEHCNHEFDKNGNPTISMGTIADITVLVENENRIKAQNKELKSLNANKDKFFSILSHDLKGPIGAMMTVANMLSAKYDKLEKAKSKKYIEVINSGTKNIYKLLENLLIWSRTQSNKVVFYPQVINLHACS